MQSRRAEDWDMVSLGAAGLEYAQRKCTHRHKPCDDCIERGILMLIEPEPEPKPDLVVRRPIFEPQAPPGWSQNGPYGWIHESGAVVHMEAIYKSMGTMSGIQLMDEALAKFQGLSFGQAGKQIATREWRDLNDD